MVPTPPDERECGGVDVTLIRWMLSLTPAERLQAMQNWANAILRIRALNRKS